MRTFDVQGIEIRASRKQVFDFLREPANLPKWAHAIKAASASAARLETPAGAVDVRLCATANDQAGTVDWQFDFQDGSLAVAHSRVCDTPRGSCIYSFVLHAPPVPLEQLEGALEMQSITLRSELATLKALMEKR